MVRWLTLLLLALPASAVHAEWHVRDATQMGTRIHLQLWHEDAAAAAALLDAGIAEIARIEAGMSTYRMDSELSLVNRRAALKPVVISAELFGLLQRALDLSAATGGAFDITYESVGYLYDFRDRERPGDAEIDARLAAIDYRKVWLDEASRTVRFARDGVRLNLGGIAKGYAVERVVEIFRDAGVRHALATAGGDTRLLGDRRGRAWVVGVRDPDDPAGVVTRVRLSDEAISTSGDYERFFIEDGVRYHHILDPATGRPAGALRSASVIGPDATLTDGLSTSVFVLGAERGLRLIEGMDGYEAVIVAADGQMRASSGLASAVQSSLQEEPTEKQL